MTQHRNMNKNQYITKKQNIATQNKHKFRHAHNNVIYINNHHILTNKQHIQQHKPITIKFEKKNANIANTPKHNQNNKHEQT